MALVIILNSLSFWFQKTDLLADEISSLVNLFSTYPEGIFKGVTKILLYTIVPVGFVIYLPVQVITNFNGILLILVVCITIIMIMLSLIEVLKNIHLVI